MTDRAYWRVRRAWNDTLRPGRVRQKAAWFIQRGRRGWSDADSWSADSYITRVLGEMLGSLADRSFGWPGEESDWKTADEYFAYLRDLSARLLAWNDESFLEGEAFRTSRDAFEESLRLLMKSYGHWWDLYRA